jgi:hypothetical protein
VDAVAVREPTPGAGAAARTDGLADAAVGGGTSRLWFERRSSGKGESIVARVSWIFAAIVVIAATAEMTVRIACRGIKGLDLLPTR